MGMVESHGLTFTFRVMWKNVLFSVFFVQILGVSERFVHDSRMDYSVLNFMIIRQHQTARWKNWDGSSRIRSSFVMASRAILRTWQNKTGSSKRGTSWKTSPIKGERSSKKRDGKQDFFFIHSRMRTTIVLGIGQFVANFELCHMLRAWVWDSSPEDKKNNMVGSPQYPQWSA